MEPHYIFKNIFGPQKPLAPFTGHAYTVSGETAQNITKIPNLPLSREHWAFFGSKVNLTRLWGDQDLGCVCHIWTPGDHMQSKGHK